MALVTGFATELLEQRRERCNAAYERARKGGAQIDAHAFLDHVATRIVPIVNAAATESPERAGPLLDSLYDLSLEMFGASLLGPSARSTAVARVWATLLPSLRSFLYRDPKRMTGALCNGAHNIDGVRSADLDAWIADLIRAAPLCDSIDDLLACGKVGAWRAGMAHYRSSAIATARAMPPKLSAGVLGLASAEPLTAETFDRLQAERWTPSSLINSGCRRRLQLVGQIGEFRGFGGEFLRPPTVAASGGDLYVSDNESVWRLFADVHGRTLVRHQGAMPANVPIDGVRALRDGSIGWGREAYRHPEATGVASSACDGVTLAVTLDTSHHVFLFALAPEPGGGQRG